jgi:transcriptional regulator with XRE-family HTH domain
MSASELSSVSGVAHKRIQALETGRLDPTYDLLLAIAQGLDIRVATLAERVEDLRRQDGATAP